MIGRLNDSLVDATSDICHKEHHHLKIPGATVRLGHVTGKARQSDFSCPIKICPIAAGEFSAFQLIPKTWTYLLPTSTDEFNPERFRNFAPSSMAALPPPFHSRGIPRDERDAPQSGKVGTSFAIVP
ncbi:hypothetical protein [Schlesneria sp. T3-172]|uniref:hypothetical protein n=1 Tax=Schlesneria sphaerica TaxID=3373610 RepID=UPI0037C6382B